MEVNTDQKLVTGLDQSNLTDPAASVSAPSLMLLHSPSPSLSLQPLPRLNFIITLATIFSHSLSSSLSKAVVIQTLGVTPSV